MVLSTTDDGGGESSSRGRKIARRLSEVGGHAIERSSPSTGSKSDIGGNLTAAAAARLKAKGTQDGGEGGERPSKPKKAVGQAKGKANASKSAASASTGPKVFRSTQLRAIEAMDIVVTDAKKMLERVQEDDGMKSLGAKANALHEKLKKATAAEKVCIKTAQRPRL